MSKAVLVTGASGHLGKAILYLLLSQHIPVVAVTGTEESAEKLRAQFDCPDLQVIRCRLEKDELSWMADHPWSGVLHCAAYIPHPKEPELPKLERIFRINVVGTWRLLEALQHKTEHLVLASSLAVYSDNGGDSAPITEQYPTEPSTFYGTSKKVAEYLATLWSRITQTPVAILRLASIFGPGEVQPRALPSFIKAALNGETIHLGALGLSRRNYVYVEDAAKAALSCYQRKLDGVMNLGGEHVFSIRELAETICDTVDNPPKIVAHPGVPAHLILDISKAKHLGLQCHTPLAVGIKKEVNWYSAGCPSCFTDYF